jgi:hypothetical protein
LPFSDDDSKSAAIAVVSVTEAASTERQVTIMSGFEGTICKRNAELNFCFIKYTKGNEEDDPEKVDDEIYFWLPKGEPLPKEGATVTFDRERDLEKEKTEKTGDLYYTAKNVKLKK